MKSPNVLDTVPGSGLYFITSGQVQRAIGRQNPFKDITDPEEQVKKVAKLSDAIKKDLNAELKTKLGNLAAETRIKK